MKFGKVILWILEIIMLVLIGTSIISNPGVTASFADLFLYRAGAVLFFAVLAAGILLEIDPMNIKKSVPLIKSNKIIYHVLFAIICFAAAYALYYICYHMTSADFRETINAMFKAEM